MYKKSITKKKNKAYQKGYRFELRVKKYYEKLGYYVKRSYASKGAEDLIAIKRISGLYASEVVLIQCKNLKVEKKLSQLEKDNLLKLAYQTGGYAVLAKNVNHKLVIQEIR